MDLKEICIPITQEVEHLERFISQSLRSSVPFIESVVEYVIKNGGKKLRPVLTILCSKLAGCRGDSGVKIGAAIEFMHTASLLHDDVIDSAQIRRGHISTNNKWGNQVSVLVGDFFYCRAMDILVNHGDIKILRIITDAVTTTTEGEIFEITKSNDISITQDDYLKIIDGKTASLIAASCQAGGILGDVSVEFEQSLYKYGHYIGLAFQLMDDVLDYTADEEKFGKLNGVDLKEGKLTLPLLWALNQAQESERQIIKNTLMSDEINVDDFTKVFEIVKRYGGIQETVKLAKKYIQCAKEKLAPFRPTLEKDALLNIADYVVLRSN